MMKLLAAPAPLPAVREMRDTGVLAQLCRRPRDANRLARLVAVEDQVAGPDPMRRLGALIADAEAAHDVAARWRLAGAEGARLAALCAPPAPLTPDLDRRNQRRRLYRLGPALFRDLVLLAWATETTGENEAAWRAMLEDGRYLGRASPARLRRGRSGMRRAIRASGGPPSVRRRGLVEGPRFRARPQSRACPSSESLPPAAARTSAQRACRGPLGSKPRHSAASEAPSRP